MFYIRQETAFLSFSMWLYKCNENHMCDWFIVVKLNNAKQNKSTINNHNNNNHNIYVCIYLYIVYSFCTTLPIAWQSICDLRSCKAMTLVRFISLSCCFMFFFSMCSFYFLLSSLWHHLLQLEVREVVVVVAGAPIQQSRWKEPEHRVLLFFSFASLSVSTQVQQWLLSENTGNISGTVGGERRRNIPLHGHATSGGEQTNRRAGSSAGWARSWRTDDVDEEMRWSSLHVPERDGIDFSMMAHNWSASWMLVVSTVLWGERRVEQGGEEN